MSAGKRVAPMDIHHQNDDHKVQYRLAKTKYPTEDSNDEFELFICPYDPTHKINFKRWKYHLERCKKNYGGGVFKNCPFNASHHIPEPEYDYHIMNCPDRNIIRQDVEGGRSSWRISTQVNHNPQWQEPDSTEDWDNEAEEVPAFYLNPDKGMPLAFRPQQKQEPLSVADSYENYVENYCDEEDNGDEHYNGEEERSQGGPTKSVLVEELIPERPPNWNDMSQSQKKNHKRKYNRQQQRMKEEGVKEEDLKRILTAEEMTEDQRNAKLAAIKAAYPLNNEKQNAIRADYTSLLNIVCQKIRLNLPEYVPISASHGGFAFKARVFQTWYEGKEYASTKKDAKHIAAKWALLGMEIPGVDGVPDPVASRRKPIHPKLLAQSQQMREADEVGKLMASGHYPKKQTVPLRQPNIQNLGSSTRPINATQQGLVASPSRGQAQQQEQQQRHQPQQQQQQHQPLQQQQQPQQWNGWGSEPNINYSHQNPQQKSMQQPQPAQSSPWLSSAMQNLDIQNGQEFPTLDDSSWKTVPTRKPAGVNQKVRGRGRGRATGMKL